MPVNSSNVSADLLWEISRSQNSFLVKRREAGGVQFSKDPFNLMNKHSRKYAGFVNDRAISVQAGEGKGVKLQTKKTGHGNRPAKAHAHTTYGSGRSTRAIYRSIVNGTTKKSYRSDLRAEAVARASAVRKSQQHKKEKPEPEPRGKKAMQKAAKKA